MTCTMDTFHAVILGLIQGLTEFLPVSSSGHLTICKSLFGIGTGNLTFEVAVHAATVLSTIVAFRKEIWNLLKGLFEFRYNTQTDYICKILVSMIPVMLVGFLLKDLIEDIFGSGLQTVGIMLLLTAVLLIIGEALSRRRQNRSADIAGGMKDTEGKCGISFGQAFVIGIAQACAVMPGLSRSGSTIAAGLMCGVRKSAVAQFSFLMVLVPILGEAFLELVGGEFSAAASGISSTALAMGALAAFISGYAACRWMISIVRRAHLWWFALYCAGAGILSIILS